MLIWIVDRHRFRRKSVAIYLAHIAGHQNIVVRDVENFDHILPEGMAEPSTASTAQVCLLGIGASDLNDAAIAMDLRELQTVLGKRPLVLMVARADSTMCGVARDRDVRGIVVTEMSGEMVLAVLDHVRKGGVYFPDLAFEVSTSTDGPAVDLDKKPMALADQGAPTAKIGAETNSLSDGMPELTARQKEVVQQLSAGHTNKIIARELGISEATVKAHIRQLLKKLQASNRTQIAIRAAQGGLHPTAKAAARQKEMPPEKLPDSPPRGTERRLPMYGTGGAGLGALRDRRSGPVCNSR